MYLLFGSITEAFSYLPSSLWGWITAVAVVAIIFLPPIKPHADHVRLQLPWLGSIERDIAHHRFFRILSLMYGISNRPVHEIVGSAAQTVSNLAARHELLKVATAIRQGLTVDEAFKQPEIILDQEQKASIAGGELSGKLEEVFDRLADTASALLETKLAWVQKISLRVITAFVAYALLSVIATLIFR